jgi:hypothetical protein
MKEHTCESLEFAEVEFSAKKNHTYDELITMVFLTNMLSTKIMKLLNIYSNAYVHTRAECTLIKLGLAEAHANSVTQIKLMRIKLCFVERRPCPSSSSVSL